MGEVTDLLEAMWFGDSDTPMMERKAAQSRAAEVAERGLKPFPASVARVARIVQDPDSSAHDLEEVLASDPVIASRVLAVANSSQFGSAARLESLRDAVVRLGASTLYEMVVEVALQQAYADLGGKGHAVIEHSAQAARCIRMLTLVHPTSHRFFYLAALLHDVGKLLLLQSGERNEADTHGDAGASSERADLGFDHGLLGAVAARSWGLPSPIPEVIGHHHELSRAFDLGGAIADGVASLRVAQDLMLLLDEKDDRVVRQVSSQTGWQWLSLDHRDAEDLIDLWNERVEVKDAIDWKAKIRAARRRRAERVRNTFAS